MGSEHLFRLCWLPTVTFIVLFLFSDERKVKHNFYNLGLLPESLLWSYIIELCSALRAVHSAGLAVRALDPSKVLVTSRGRLRLCGGGICDVLTYDTNASNPTALVQHYQVIFRFKLLFISGILHFKIYYV